MSNLGGLGVPSADAPVGSYTDEDGKTVQVKLAHVWYRLITRLAQLNAERPIAVVTPTGSPFLYEATTIGHLVVIGGTVSAAVLRRGVDSLNITFPGTVSPFIPMTAGDQVTLTYSVAPTLRFVPGARA